MCHFELSVLLPASPVQVYRAWLCSSDLGNILGGPAFVDPAPGGRFLARGGEVEGYLFDLKPHQIVQTWRTPDLPRRCADSMVALMLETFGAGYSRLTLEHVQIPENLVAAYERAWREDYLESMRRYFAALFHARPAIQMPAFQTI